MIGLDNNTAERMIRGPVVTRKNAGGSRNGDTARNAAVIWTVTATAQMAGLNLLTWLTAYLDECGRNGGKPLAGPDLDRFLPWNASPGDLRTWAQRRHRPDKPAANTPAPAWLPNRPRGYQHAISQHSEWRKRRSEPEREHEIISQHGQHVALHVLRSKRAVREFLDGLDADHVEADDG